MPNMYGGNIGFGPYSAEQSEALRKQRLSEMLMQQGMKPPQAQQGGRFAVPISPLQGLSQVLSAGAGAHLQKQAGEQASGIAQKQQADRAQALARALQQAQGSPQPDASMGGGPAMPADPVGAMGTLAQSQDPSVMQMGAPAINMQQQQMRQQQEQAFRTQQADAERAAREQRETSERAWREQQAAAARKQQEDMARLTSSLRPQPQQRQQQIIQTQNGPMVLGDDGVARPITSPGGQQVQAPARQGGPMTATAQRELIETEEQVQGGQAALQLFQQAKALNDKAMGFTGAGAVASAGTLLPGFLRPGTVDATQNLDNILQSAALPQLKAIFGGMPTEGERKILLDVQGSSSKPPQVRADIFKRAEAAIERRIKFNAEKAKRLREGSYFTGEGLPSLQMEGAGGSFGRRTSDNAPAPGTVMQGYRFKGGDPADRSNWEKAN